MLSVMGATNRRRLLAYAAIAALCKTFPAAFARHGARRPLKIGIDRDLVARGVDADVIRAGLGSYCRSPAYLLAQRAGAARVDLDGNAAGTVTAEEAASARERLAKKKLRRKAAAAAPASAKPWPKLSLPKHPPRAA
jgi:ProP effector